MTTDRDLLALADKLDALIAKQRDERGDMMTLGRADPEVIEARDTLRALAQDRAK